MSGREKRRHERFAVRTEVTVVRGKRSIVLRTEDVSFSGLFILTEDPPPLRELVQIKMVLPSDGQSTALMGMAVHRVPPGGPRKSGIGVLLYGLDPQTKSRWDTFVQQVRMGKHGGTPTGDLPPVSPPEAPPVPTPPADPGQHLCPELRVRLPTEDALRIVRDRDLERARTFVRTDLYLEPDTQVVVEFVHPESARTFQIPGHVMKRIEQGDIVGLGIALDGIDAQVKADFAVFADDEIHVTVDLDIEFMDIDDVEGL